MSVRVLKQNKTDIPKSSNVPMMDNLSLKKKKRAKKQHFQKELSKKKFLYLIPRRNKKVKLKRHNIKYLKNEKKKQTKDNNYARRHRINI